MEEELIEIPPVPGPFFRFTDEAAWLTAARAAGFMTDVPVYDDEGVQTGTEEKLIAYTSKHAIDVVGTITEGGEWDMETGEELVAPTVLPGYHVNYLGALPEGWEAFEVKPTTPYRVFA
jgi:hypothetical protein